MGFLGIGNSRFRKIGAKGKSTFIGVKQGVKKGVAAVAPVAKKGALAGGKVLTTAGKVAFTAGKVGVAVAPMVSAFDPKAGMALGQLSGKAVAGGTLAKMTGRGLKHASKGKLANYDPARAAMRK